MRKLILTHKLVFLLLVLLIVEVASLVVWRQQVQQPLQSEQPLPQIVPNYLIADGSHIYQITSLLSRNPITKTYKYSEVLNLVSGRAIVTKQDMIYYLQFADNGEITREIELGVRPDLVLSMSSQLLVSSDGDYFIYVIPLRGFRVFRINLDNSINENYYPLNEFFKLYSDNSIFLIQQKIYIPNGGLSLYTIDTQANTIAGENIDAQVCGAGAWEINHNMDNVFILRSDTEICVYDFAANAVLQKLSLGGHLWFRILPGKSTLAVENWETLGNFPASSGQVRFYKLENGELISTVNLGENPDFKQQLSDSPGGYSLLGGAYFDSEKGELFLSTRAGMQTYFLQLDSSFNLKGFAPSADFRLETISAINR